MTKKDKDDKDDGHFTSEQCIMYGYKIAHNLIDSCPSCTMDVLSIGIAIILMRYNDTNDWDINNDEWLDDLVKEVRGWLATREKFNTGATLQ